MAVAVHCDLVSRCDDLARERRALHDLLADQEERGVRTVAGELLQHRGRSLCVRPVVEGDGNDRTVDAAIELQVVREARHVGGERGREPSHVTSESTSEAADGIAASARPGACRVTSAPRSARSRSSSLSTTSAIP